MTPNIQDILNKPAKAETLRAMRAHEARVRFHAETLPSEKRGEAETAFLNWVGALLKPDKFYRFRTLFRPPYATTALVDEIHEKLNRVFSASDASETAVFTDADAEADWSGYSAEAMRSWQGDAQKALRYAINSVVLVDMPAEPGEGLPAPYYSFIGADAVLDYAGDTDGTLLWLAVRVSADRVAVVDAEKYELYATEGNQARGLVLSSPHALGYCPAAFFWGDALNADGQLKKAPVSAFLSDLDWLLFFSTSKKHLDLYAPYPIYSSYAVDCDYESDTEVCAEGHLRHKSAGLYLFDHTGGLKECPKCSAKRFVGPGSFVEVPAPQYENDPDLKDPVRITTIDDAALKYNVSEVERLRKAIYTGTVGTDSSILDTEAVNELQVNAAFESQRAVLMNLARNLARIKAFVIETICGLRYGDKFAGASVTMGTDFHIRDKQAALGAYLQARDSGMPYAYMEGALHALMKVYGAGSERAAFLAALEPLKHLDTGKLVDMAERGYIAPEMVKIRLNFADLVARFERENAPVTEFGGELPRQERIDLILKTLISYVNTEKTD